MSSHHWNISWSN